MFQADPRNLLQKVDAVFAVHHKTFWQFLGKILKILHYCVQIGNQFRYTDKENFVAFAYQCWERLEQNTRILHLIVFSKKFRFSLHDAENMKSYRIWGFRSLETVNDSLQSTSTLARPDALSLVLRQQVDFSLETVPLLETNNNQYYGYCSSPSLPITFLT